MSMVLFTGDSPAVAENFAKADPYVSQGLVRRWHVREWTTVAGKAAAGRSGSNEIQGRQRSPMRR